MSDLGEGTGVWKGTHAGARRREFTRWPHANPAMLLLRNTPGVSSYEVACRDISCRGVGIRSPREAQVGTPCVIILRSRTRSSAVSATGMVARCEQIRPGLYSVGVRLDQQIDLEQIITRDPLAGHDHEHVEPEQLHALLSSQGIAVVTSNPNDAKMISSLLGSTYVLTPKSRQELTDQTLSLAAVVLEENTPLGELSEVAVDLYCSGFVGKIVLVTPDAGDHSRRLLEKLPVASAMVRPLDRDRVLCALADALREHTSHANKRLKAA